MAWHKQAALANPMPYHRPTMGKQHRAAYAAQRKAVTALLAKAGHTVLAWGTLRAGQGCNNQPGGHGHHGHMQTLAVSGHPVPPPGTQHPANTPIAATLPHIVCPWGSNVGQYNARWAPGQQQQHTTLVLFYTTPTVVAVQAALVQHALATLGYKVAWFWATRGLVLPQGHNGSTAGGAWVAAHTVSQAATANLPVYPITDLYLQAGGTGVLALTNGVLTLTV